MWGRRSVTLQELYAQYAPILRPILRIGPIFGGVAMLAWRVRETRVPVTTNAIVIPPLAMSSGFLIFAMPMARVPWTWAIATFLLGFLVLSYPLTNSTKLEPRDGVIYMQRSRAFLAILLALLAIRLALHDYIGHLVSPLQTASLFFLLAFGMIARWRWTMLRQFRALQRDGAPPAPPARPERR
ncbi:MAG TPA: cytochrome c biogenesis protein CcdC [Gemmatimonadaceae bacterium]|nr:cytochrome c biogenesis protein CcdC [Gemmatimonadaceae bacterium]